MRLRVPPKTEGRSRTRTRPDQHPWQVSRRGPEIRPHTDGGRRRQTVLLPFFFLEGFGVPGNPSPSKKGTTSDRSWDLSHSSLSKRLQCRQFTDPARNLKADSKDGT